ncbi:MAG: hypothetical protein ABSH06_11705 [Thermodesulfobacteriota bacterium]
MALIDPITGKPHWYPAEDRKLAASTIKEETVSTGSKSRKSRTSEELGDTVNRVSTPKTPCLTPTEGVNPLETIAERPTEGRNGVSQGVSLEIDDLFGAIKEFLESKEIEVYRGQSVPECYQVKHNGQTIRFYAQRNE